MKEPLVYIIVLNYNNYRDTIECIKSLEEIDYLNYKIVIVDNNSNNESHKVLEEKYSKKHVYIQTGKNLGYAGGNNVGINYALKCKTDYVCILNNDTIVSPQFLKRLVEYAESNIDVGIVGPAILEYNNEKVVQSTGAIIDISRGNVNQLNHMVKLLDLPHKEIECDYVGGACMLVRRNVIEDVGLIPENYFLFYEETEWCYRAKIKGYRIMCYLESEILHKGSVSINAISGLSEYFMNRNKIVFINRNATFKQKVHFYPWFAMKTLWSIIKDIKNVKLIKYYYHGLFNRIDKKYSFVYIKK